MFLLMEEKVQVLAREKRPVEEEGGCVLWVCLTNAKLLSPWIGIRGLWVLQKMVQAVYILQLLI